MVSERILWRRVRGSSGEQRREPRECRMLWGWPSIWLGFEPVRISGHPTTHPNALRARIDSCRAVPDVDR